MKPEDKDKLEACTALIASLEEGNMIQRRLIEAQAAIIQSLEEHNAELERIINDFASF